MERQVYREPDPCLYLPDLVEGDIGGETVSHYPPSVFGCLADLDVPEPVERVHGTVRRLPLSDLAMNIEDWPGLVSDRSYAND